MNINECDVIMRSPYSTTFLLCTRHQTSLTADVLSVDVLIVDGEDFRSFTMADIAKLDLYLILEVSPDATEKEVSNYRHIFILGNCNHILLKLQQFNNVFMWAIIETARCKISSCVYR